jgi:hypothetical protein
MLKVMYPSDPYQPGPIYFMVPRRCALFGVACEGRNTQHTYLIDEAVNSGKGANAVVSYLDQYLTMHANQARVLHLHTDNCSGQNKNNVMLSYLMWRVATGLNTEIHLHFMIAGHTKFAVDWGFGLIKRKFRKTKVDCLQDIMDVVNQSSSVNKAVLVGRED